MSLVSIFIFIAGVLVGGGASRHFGKRQPASLFIDDAEGAVLREEAIEAVTTRIIKRKNRILEQPRANGRITNDDVEDLYCISDRTASSYLRQLTESGALVRHGAGRGTCYTPVEK